MKRLLAGFLAVATTCASSVYAQTGHTVSERALSSGQSVLGSNEAGWYVVEGFTNSKESLTLNGPKGYTRDIGSLAPGRGTDGALTLDSAYFVAVDGSGAVYFAQNVSRTSSGGDPIYLGSVVKKLALNSNTAVDFYSDINDPDKVLRSVYRINTQGHLLKLQNIVSGTQKQVVMKKFVNGVESEQTIPFTDKGSDRNVLDLIDLDSTGGFAVSRRATRVVRSGNRDSRAASTVVLAGLCTGNMLSQNTSCASTDALNRKGFSVAGMSGGSVIVTRSNMRTRRSEYARLDPASFDRKSSFSVPQSLGYSSLALAANGDITNLQASAPLGLKKFQLVTHLEAGGRRKVICTMKSRINFDNRINSANSIQTLSDGGFLIFGSRNRAPVVLELTPAGVSEIPASAAGRCVVE